MLGLKQNPSKNLYFQSRVQYQSTPMSTNNKTITTSKNHLKILQHS